MEHWVIALLILDVALGHYGFEFQRTTLGISRGLAGLAGRVELAGLQANLTPTWVGLQASKAYARHPGKHGRF